MKPAKKSSLASRLLLSLAALLMTVTILEVVAHIYSRLRHGPNYLRDKIAVRSEYLNPIGADRMNAARSWESKLQLHPLFGYVYFRSVPGANNYGFVSDHDFEITTNGYAISSIDRSQSIVLGFFGGSFAFITCNQTKEFLAAELSRLFPGRTPVILNFAHGGYALPQTFSTFAYFRSVVDIPVFIDGLNEPWNYYRNNASGFPPEYAKASHWAYRLSASELTPTTFEATRQLLLKRKRVGQLTSLSLSRPQSYSVLLHFVWNAHRARAESAAATITRSIADSYALSAEPFHSNPPDELFAFAAGQWRDYHRLVHSISAQSGLMDLHFLQPNAFAPGSAKTLTADEVDILARDNGSRYVVTNAYPLLRQELTELTELGVACVDMSTAFNGVNESIWTDYCHANKRGGMLVAQRIVEEIETRCEQWNPPYSEPASRLQKR